MPKPKFYAVRKGRQTGIFESWAECSDHVHGYPGAVYKSFPSMEGANAFLSYGASAAAPSTQSPNLSDNSDVILLSDSSPLTVHAPAAVTSRSSSPIAVAPEVPIPFSASSNSPTLRAAGGPIRNSLKHFVSAVASTHHEPMVIYTDGSCLKNGGSNAVAGIGAWFGHMDPRNISESLPGQPQTNQRAEIYAVLRALDSIDSKVPVEIRTDSMYVINAMTSWINKWRLNDYNRNTVQNHKLFKMLDARIKRRSAPVTFKYVKAHAGIVGNEGADQLAKRGAESLITGSSSV